MTTATMSLDVIETATYCDCCDEEAPVLTPSPADAGYMLCPVCLAEKVAEVEAEARQEAIDAAEESANDADAEVESIEDEIKAIREQYLADLAEARERLAEAKRTAKAARKDLDKLTS